MSSAAEGWYVDPSTGTNLRYWSGSTWTDEVAPLPADAPKPGQFTAQDVEPAPADMPAQALEPAPADAEAAEHPPLDRDLEHTQLTRRELRARRGSEPDLNDAPKHLPPIAPPPVAVATVDEPPVELELEIVPVEEAAPPAPEPSAEDTPGTSRRRRIVRLSILLGILAVVSSVGVLTAGTL